MAVIWVEMPEESGRTIHTRTNHIPVERLREVTHNCDLFLNDLETHHLYHCRQCLDCFGDLALPDDVTLFAPGQAAARPKVIHNVPIVKRRRTAS